MVMFFTKTNVLDWTFGLIFYRIFATNVYGFLGGAIIIFVICVGQISLGMPHESLKI